MENNPLVSVVMPVYSFGKYGANAVKSILDQSYRNFEFIIVNDGSKDKTLDILKSYKKKDKRIIIVDNKKNLGVTKSLNKALDLANGKYIIRMDADDWSYPERFKLQVNLMENNPEVVVSGSYIQICDSKLKPMHIRHYPLDDADIRKHLFRYSPFAHPATIWRADMLKKERYDERINVCQDYELYFRMGKIGKFMNLNRPLLKLRMHEGSISTTLSDIQSKNTVLIRFNAVLMHKYNMSSFDKLYNFSQELVINLIPVKLRFIIFNFLRKFNFY